MSSFASAGLSSSVGDELPGLLPPAGTTSNFKNPASVGDVYTGVATAIIVMMVLLVTNRQYTKYYIIQKLGWDDLTCLIAEIFAIARYVIWQYEVSAGYIGIHQWNVPLSYMIGNQWLIPAYFGVVVGPVGMIFTKLTFYLVYLQVFQPFRWFRICVYIGAALTTAYYVGVEIYTLVSLTPKQGQSWAAVALSPAQHKSVNMSLPNASVGLVTDLYLLILPIAAVMQLQLPARRKIGLILIFLTGLAACIASAISIYYRVLLDRSADYTWNIMPVNICQVAEMGIGLCCISMPALSKMIAYQLPRLQTFGSWMSSRSASARSGIRQASFSQPFGLLKRLRSRGSKSSHGQDSYLDLENNDDLHLEMGAPRLGALTYDSSQKQTSVRTIIGTGHDTQIQTAGIHVEVKLQQKSRHCDGFE